MEITLTHAEAEVLRDTIEGFLHELRIEISHTGMREFREQLRERERLLERLLETLSHEAAAGTTP